MYTKESVGCIHLNVSMSVGFSLSLSEVRRCVVLCLGVCVCVRDMSTAVGILHGLEAPEIPLVGARR